MDLSVSPELMSAMEDMMKPKYNLKVPDYAETRRDWTRWPEVVVIEAAYRQPKEGREGQQRMMFVIKVKVLPYGETPNEGKIRTTWPLVNFGVMRGESEAVGNGNIKDEIGFSARNFNKIKQIFVALGGDLSGGLTHEQMDAMFPEVSEDFRPSELDLPDSNLVGSKFTAQFVQDGRETKKDQNGEFRQDIDAFMEPPGDIT